MQAETATTVPVETVWALPEDPRDEDNADGAAATDDAPSLASIISDGPFDVTGAPRPALAGHPGPAVLERSVRGGPDIGRGSTLCHALWPCTPSAA